MKRNGVKVKVKAKMNLGVRKRPLGALGVGGRNRSGHHTDVLKYNARRPDLSALTPSSILTGIGDLLLHFF